MSDATSNSNFQNDINDLRAEIVDLKLESVSNRIRVRALKRKLKSIKNSTKSITPMTPKLFITMVISTFCGYQAFSITEVYLKYDVTAEALFFPTDPIIPPMLTICILRNDTGPFVNSKQTFASNLKFYQVINMFMIRLPNAGIAVVSARTLPDIKVTSFLLRRRVCHSFDLDKIGKDMARNIVYSFEETRAATTQVLLSLLINNSLCNATDKCFVTIREPKNFAIKYLSGIPIESNTSLAVYYEKQELNLQPPPYTTNCFNYNAQNISNQDDCFVKCIKRESVNISDFSAEFTKSFNAARDSTHNVTVGMGNNSEVSQYSQNSSIPTVPAYVPVFSHEHYRLDMIMPVELFPRLKDCKLKCSRVSCRLQQFTTTSISRDLKPLPVTQVVLNLPQNGELKVFYKPKITMVEYFTLFGSVFSLWFGISAFQVINQLTNCLYKKNVQNAPIL